MQWAIDARVDTRDREATGDCFTDEVGAGSGLFAASLLAAFGDGEVTTAAVVSFPARFDTPRSGADQRTPARLLGGDPRRSGRHLGE